MFTYKSYNFDKKKKKAEFFYQINSSKFGNYEFKEELDFSEIPLKSEIDPWLEKNLLFFLHLILGISYWKLTCEKGIKLENGHLTKAQAHFFEKLYKKGLGEFFFQNKIDFRGLVNFPYQKISGFRKRERPLLASPKRGGISGRCLVPIGGGKDSTLTLKLLEEAGVDFEVFTLGDYEVCNEIAKKFGKTPLKIKRKIDPQIVELNKTGKFHNGHVPISAVYAATALFTAVHGDFDQIVLSNESSANECNTEWNGMKINHQYTKTLEFEELVSTFIKKFITNVNYFSLLRPFSETKITKLFTEKCGEIFSTFTSCNANFRFTKKAEKKWCGNCPKCAFVFVMFSAYLGVKKTSEIFGKNLFEDKDLLQTFLDLTGYGKLKPFECVGTFDEIKSAFAKILESEKEGIVLQEIVKKKPVNKLKDFENYFGENFVPEEFGELIKEINF